MATRIRTLNFLPDIFQTVTNSQFLGATLDNIVDQPNTQTIQGYIGNKFGNGINLNKGKYVPEPTKTRTDYQLDPAVVFLKENTPLAKDFITYPGILDAIKLENGLPNNNERLFNSQFYSWDSFANLDTLVNYNQYYWITDGPEAVTVETPVVYDTEIYDVTNVGDQYLFTQTNGDAKLNPTINLIRGGTYTFNVNQTTEFWIQGEPGITGYDPNQPNLQTRDVLGVVNNGAKTGAVTFLVPFSDAQAQYNFPGNNLVDLVCTLPFASVDGQPLSTIGNIDGVTAVNGLTLMFYYANGSGLAYTTNYYTINVVGGIVNLVLGSAIPTEQKITATQGTQFIGRHFFRNTTGAIELIPYLSAEKDVLYYQDGTSPSKFGKISLSESTETTRIDVIADILGKTTYTAPNGVVFTNGLKVQFNGNVFPTSYLTGEYYVQGVGSAIQLVPVDELQTFENSNLYSPDVQDYITIARNSIDRNPWSRSNRWFHIDVINDTATYNNNPNLVSLYATTANKAKRPIIEFYPNIRLFNMGTVSKGRVTYINFSITDAFSQVAGTTSFQPDGSAFIQDGDTIIFAGDTDENVKNKIYRVDFSSITGVSTPVITLTEVPDGLAVIGEQVEIVKGTSYSGQTFYFSPFYDVITQTYILQWNQGQSKLTTNQPPLFDVFDSNGISFGNQEIYNSSDFIGNKLLAYGIGAGSTDSVLGFPIRYSGQIDTGDISFDVSLNLDSFNYVTNGVSTSLAVNTGYVYIFSDVDNFDRSLGWQTAIAPSTQYQIFDFKWSITNPITEFVCDVAKLASSEWPTIQLFLNNERQNTDTYTFVVADTQTTVNYTVPEGTVETVVQILLLSNQVSKTAYYTVPINLSNNPFNQDVEKINLGDIRNQYQTIFYNCPNTSGVIFGANNYRDLGNIVPYGTAIIQNSASLVLPGTFLRNQKHNLFDALLYNSREYITFKNLLVYTVNNSSYDSQVSANTLLDDALDQITANRDTSGPFFWSDMLPSKTPYLSNTYTFKSSIDSSIFPLSQVYNFNTANYNGVIVYLIRNNIQTQLINNQDYVISQDSRSLTITLNLIPNDKIIINEYNQTYGSYVPNTPTKLGLYPSTIPTVIGDPAYQTPTTTYFIVGHDGSYNKLYGNYDPVTQQLDDYRDQVLLEFEKRIYNNLKLGYTIPVRDYDVIPGFFRTTKYSYDEILEIYSEGFLNWVGENRITYKTQFYNAGNEYTYNYNQSGNKINREKLLQGYWRGIYQYFYDSFNPDSMPWQLIGFTDKPDWWETRYGPAPYTSDNTLLWSDLAQGISWNNGNPVVLEAYVRPQLLQVLPVDSEGNLVSPFISIVGNYSNQTFKRDWVVGDVGPSEFSYRRSSSYPFDLMRILALTEPANFFNLGVDMDNYRYSSEFNQFLVNDRSHLVISDIQIYGSGTPKTSYINWIVDYEKQVGIDATTNITTLFDNLDVRLAYRVAGFSDKTKLQFFVEKGSSNDTNSSLLIPDESYQVLLYENQPFDRLIYSSVIVQLSDNNTFKIYGNSQNKAYFKTLVPIINGNYSTVNLFNVKVLLANDYYENKTVTIPYGTEFYTLQEVAQFLESYGRYIESQGATFETIESGLQVSWRQMIYEFLYWAQTGWAVGSIINLNPAAKDLSINRDGYVVQPLTLQQQNFVLNQNNYPIASVDLSIVRDETLFNVKPLNQGDTIAYGQFNLSNIEHGIVFNNLTLFNDVIYDLVTGLRQNRILVRGVKTAEWNGTLNASGFILNQDNILEWNKDTKYTKGAIVKYKNKYWTALKIIQPAILFQEKDWKETPYDQIQKGLLANSSTRSYESTLYYDVNKANLENDADLLSFSLIGFRPREYMALADLTDITQVNVYKNLIKNKGTKNSVYAFRGANLPQGGIDYQVYENWAIKTGEYGGVLNQNFVDLPLDSALLTGNPSIIAIVQNSPVIGAQQSVPIYAVYNFGRPITNVNVLPTLPNNTPVQLMPYAGYVNINDVKTYSYYFSGLSTSITPLNKLYVNDYIWVANIQGSWQVYVLTSFAVLLEAQNNNNGTVNLTFDQPHNLVKNDLFAIINFNFNLDGYYIVSSVVNNYTVQISLSLNPTYNVITGNGVGLKLNSHKVAQPSDIANLDLMTQEFVNNRVWVDVNNDGNWAVYEKTINYSATSEFYSQNSTSFGYAVAVADKVGYLISDPEQGEIYRYAYNPITQSYILRETFAGDYSFGTCIAHTSDLYVFSTPNSGTPQFAINTYIKTTELDGFVTVQDPINISTNAGKAIAISGDKNWIFVSNEDSPTILVYSKNQTTGKYELSNTIYPNATASDKFGFSLSTNYYGTSLFVGAPYKNYGDVADYGFVYVYDRLVQRVVAPFNSLIGTPQIFLMQYQQPVVNDTVLQTLATNNVIVTSNSNGSVTIFTPVFFTGSGFGNLLSNTMYYVYDVISSTQFTLSTSKYTGTCTATTSITNRIIYSSSSTVNVGDPIRFSGWINASGLIAGQVYYVRSTGVDIDGHTYMTIEDNTATIIPLNSTQVNLTFEALDGFLTQPNAFGNLNCYFQTSDTIVYQNSNVLSDSEYGFDNLYNLYILKSLVAGDIITYNTNYFSQSQILTSNSTVKIGENFGYSLDVNKYGSELIVGAPFNINQTLGEGALFRFTNGAAKYGTIIGTRTCNATSLGPIFINGYVVYVQGTASQVATLINSANIPNIIASDLDGKLVISCQDVRLADVNDKLTIMSQDYTRIVQLGLDLFTFTQEISCPHNENVTQFGHKVKFNEFNSFVASAVVGDRFLSTTFDDISMNETIDTVFDNNATQFVDTVNNTGSVYMFDYLSNYDESLANIGKFVYAQSVNPNNLQNGLQAKYGSAIDFNNNFVVVSAPYFDVLEQQGQVVGFQNNIGVPNWSESRQPINQVDIRKLQNIQIYSSETNNTLVNLDYFDPLQGKLLGVVAQNTDYVCNVDPASYNSPSLENAQGLVWGPEQIGSIWIDTSNLKYMDYHQNDIVYNSKYWGQLFPGSDVAVYSWITSNVPPIQYTGPGIPYNINSYTVLYNTNTEGVPVPLYYFWAKNTNILFTQKDKTLSDFVIQNYMLNPQGSGVSYLSPLSSNTYGLYNSQSYIANPTSKLHIGYSTGTNDDVGHDIYSLIRAGFEEDFLPGVPGVNGITTPVSLYNRLLGSLSGVDVLGGEFNPNLPSAIVPDPFLPLPVQSGVLTRPRQSFFYNRLGALQNYVTFINSIVIKYPFNEIAEATFLFKIGPTNPSTGQPFYNTTDYWYYVNWWAEGYSDQTKSNVEVSIYADLATLNASPGLIAKVTSNSQGNAEYYLYTTEGLWERIGLENGTFQISDAIWDYSGFKIGYDAEFFDSVPLDAYPSEETRWIIRATCEQFPDQFLIFRNESLILLFEYIQSETIEYQNYLPWLNKTSLIDVSHKIRELLPIQVYQSDNQDFLAGYINEVKPYHVVIKDFLFSYTGSENYDSNPTDFDLPATYNSTYSTFISPQLVYTNPTSIYEYGPSNDIWQNIKYQDWYNNYGLSLVGQQNYAISTLTAYVDLTSLEISVSNIDSYPTQGVIKLLDALDPTSFELIRYTVVDLFSGRLLGITRGYSSTTISTHIPGQQVYIDLDGVILLNGARGYANVPQVVAYIDTTIYPAPREAAQLRAVMNLDSIAYIEVINPGSGYAVQPQIIIDPALTITINTANVRTYNNTILIGEPSFITGDLVQYKALDPLGIIPGLVNNNYYYVHLLESGPYYIIALYDNYHDCINDDHRVVLLGSGSGTNNKLYLSAKAITIPTSQPVRENIITLKYDRTSYTPQVVDWEANTYYAGTSVLIDYQFLASSGVQLESVIPPINTLLSSTGGQIFTIVNVNDLNETIWSTRPRNVTFTYGPFDLLYPNCIQLNSYVGGATAPTTGFYVGMPVKFTNSIISEIASGVTYYVHTVVDAQRFTISTTKGGPVRPLSASVGLINWACYGAVVTEKTIVTIDYKGILNVTQTQAGTNFIKVPYLEAGLGGTTGMYVGQPVMFTGTTFGNVLPNVIYYINGIADGETFTISLNNNPIIVDVTATTVTSNRITCNSTSNLSVGDPIIFTDMQISGNSVTNFGNLISGVTYYIQTIVNSTQFTVSTLVNGPLVTLANASGTCSGTSQRNSLPLTNATGNMTANVGYPLSPGQINGQLFRFYQSGLQYPLLTGTTSDLIVKDITQTLAASNRILLFTQQFGLTSLYNNLAFTLDSNIGSLTTGTTYYVINFGVTTVNVTEANGFTNLLTCPNTNVLANDMKINFSGTVFGGISPLIDYYVTVVSPTQFSVSLTLSGPTVNLLNEVGLMTATGPQFMQLSTTPGGSSVALTNDIGSSTLTQYIPPGNDPVFNVTYILGGYTVNIQSAGLGYAPTNTITIPGNLVGGVTPTNDVLITVDQVSTTGQIEQITVTGTPTQLTVNDYYLKVVSDNEVEVYYDATLLNPVPYSQFVYKGIYDTIVTGHTALDQTITVSDITDFQVNDVVYFTAGTSAVPSFFQVGQPYFITLITPKTGTTGDIQVSLTTGGSPVTIIGTTTGLSYNMSRSGDFAYISQPYTFNQSLVKYNNNIYACSISNNDSIFVPIKWTLLQSDNRNINALDRIVAYYKPSSSNTLAWNNYLNMPGLDISQLVNNTTWPYNIYQGNPFAPDEELPLDTLLQDRVFSPIDVDNVAIVYDGTTLITALNTNSNSELASSITGTNWVLRELVNLPVNFTDIIYAGGRYIVTAFDPVSQLYISTNNITYTSLNIGTQGINAIAHKTGNVYVAVGDNIATSNTNFDWNVSYTFLSPYTNIFYGVVYCSIPGYTGFIAVGKGQEVQLGIVVDIPLIFTSTNNGVSWNQNTSVAITYGFKSIASDNFNIIVLVGENGICYTTNDGIVYTPHTTGVLDTLNKVSFVNGIFIAVGDNGAIITSPDGVVWTVETSGTTENLFGITYDGTQYVVVGYNNTVLLSTDNVIWTSGAVYQQEENIYDVQGAEFEFGYGPEELVPGLVKDNLTMIITTRPGTTWDYEVYEHVGYNVISFEIPLIASVYTYGFGTSIQEVAPNPANLGLFIIDDTTGLSTSLYEGNDYTIDWINYEVTLNPGILITSPNVLRLDVYEVGNGNQLYKSNTKYDPLITNPINGFQYIDLHCNYSSPYYLGSGVVRPLSKGVTTTATITDSITDSIICDDVTVFTVNSPITFEGAVFGNIALDTIYFVKSINYLLSSITVSTSLVSGIAGPTFGLTSDTGSMTVIIEPGSGSIFADPYITNNGIKLELGDSYIILRTNGTTNQIFTDDISGLIAGYSTISFANPIFGGITPLIPYNVLTVDAIAISFQIEDPSNPGNPLPLTDAFGSALAITQDCAYALSSNGVTAELVFTGTYVTSVDYLSYTVFGESIPAQYGYTLPQTQIIISDVTLDGPYTLTNFVGGSNPTNAIVELDGVRLNPSTYTIDPVLDEITFTPGTILSAGQNIAVTTFNDTNRQYFLTNVISVASNQQTIPITNISNTLSLPIAITKTDQVSSTGNILTCASTTGFIVGQTVEFQVQSGGGLGNVLVDGTVYFIDSIVSPTEFTISQTYLGPVFDPGTQSGFPMITVVGSQPAIRVTTSIPHGFVTNDVIIMDGIIGATQLNEIPYYIHVIDDVRYDLYLQPYNPTLGATNVPVTTMSPYISGGFAFLKDSIIITDTTATDTSSVDNSITVLSTSTLVVGTPVVFTGTVFGNIVANQKYFVKTINSITNKITVSETYQGPTFTLSTDSGTMGVCQWIQTNVDRLWVTLNGYRIPSSSLRLLEGNSLAILIPLAIGDELIITSMIPSATPDELRYIQIVDQYGIQKVYGANQQYTGWITQPVYYTDNTIYVDDVSKFVDITNIAVTSPAPVNGVISIGINANKNSLIQVEIYNASTAITLSNTDFSIGFVNDAPTLLITNNVNVGDVLSITIYDGNLLYVQGEQIRFGSVDTLTNSLGNLSRGVNGTSTNAEILEYAEAYPLLQRNLLNPAYYDQTWNSNNFNTTQGDPLQISDTQPAIFLQTNNY